MTKTEHLQKIKAKCEERIKEAEFERAMSLRTVGPTSIAGWRSTIAGIDHTLSLQPCDRRDWMEKNHIAAWPEELL